MSDMLQPNALSINHILGIIVNDAIVRFDQCIVDDFFVDIDHSDACQFQSNRSVTHLTIQRINVLASRHIAFRARYGFDETGQIVIVQIIGDMVVAVHATRRAGRLLAADMSIISEAYRCERETILSIVYFLIWCVCDKMWLTSSKARSLRMIIALVHTNLIVMIQCVQFAASSAIAIPIVVRDACLGLENLGRARFGTRSRIAILTQLLLRELQFGDHFVRLLARRRIE